MKSLGLLSLLVAVLCVHCDEQRRYDGYKVYSVFPLTKAQTDFISELSQDVELDFWYEGADKFDIFVSPAKQESFTQQLSARSIHYEVVEENMQNLIDMEKQQMAEWKAEPGMAVDYNNWNTYQQIMDELDLLAARCRSPTNCAVETVGNSLQGRAIKALRMWRTGTNRRTVWVDATIHAREWLATSTHLLFMKHMVDDVNDATVADFINRFDFYFIPVMNPDGYSYSHTNERLWRKNRRTNSGSTCIGVDLNRNYAQMWGNAGAATNPCSETYRGASAGSEPETAVIQAALRSRGPSLLFSMHIHTYGQLWLIPWGSVTSSGACNIASDHNAMMVIANAGANAVQATYGTSWSRGNSCATIYPASGLTMDYSKGVAGVFFTVTPELRGNNFVVNTNQINPAYLETWNGLAATVRAL